MHSALFDEGQAAASSSASSFSSSSASSSSFASSNICFSFLLFEPNSLKMSGQL